MDRLGFTKQQISTTLRLHTDPIILWMSVGKES